MIEIVRFSYSNKKLVEISMNIRQEVFVKEQHVDTTLEYDGQDSKATHYILYFNKIPIGTARWRLTSKGIKLERFAILQDYRNKGIGKNLLEKVLTDVISENQVLYLHAQEKAVSYYQRAGFAIVGNIFIEAGINHYKMVFVNK